MAPREAELTAAWSVAKSQLIPEPDGGAGLGVGGTGVGAGGGGVGVGAGGGDPPKADEPSL